MSMTYTDPVVVERMPDYLRDSHRAARNWGRYPANGAERVIVERSATEQWTHGVDDDGDDAWASIEADEYDHIVCDATTADFERYEAK